MCVCVRLSCSVPVQEAETVFIVTDTNAWLDLVSCLITLMPALTDDGTDDDSDHDEKTR